MKTFASIRHFPGDIAWHGGDFPAANVPRKTLKVLKKAQRTIAQDELRRKEKNEVWIMSFGQYSK